MNGVLLPAEGTTYSTWDPARKASPSQDWRRWGTDRLIGITLCVIGDHHDTHPDAPRVIIGDISLPTGGPFGREYGGLGHISHQNGLDVDVYYPRRDGRETVPLGVQDIDLARSPESVDRFIAAGAIRIFVGRRTGVARPGRIVRFAHNHDDHFHVRFAGTDVRPPAGSA